MGKLFEDVERILVKHLLFLDEEEYEELGVFLEALVCEKTTKLKDPDNRQEMYRQVRKRQFQLAGEHYNTLLKTRSKLGNRF